MLRQQGMRWIAALALLAILAAPVAGQAAGKPAPGPEGGLTILWNRLLDWMGGGLPWLSTTAADCDRGVMIDPDGRCVNLAAPPTTTAECDRGASVDPNGGCVASASTLGGR